MASWPTPREAEIEMAHAMRGMGFADAVATQASRDGGIDVHSSEAVAQVKMHFKPTGGGDVQKLLGAAMSHPDKQVLFFSAGGYSAAAEELALQHNVALFTFDTSLRASPHNRHAHMLKTTDIDRERLRQDEPPCGVTAATAETPGVDMDRERMRQEELSRGVAALVADMNGTTMTAGPARTPWQQDLHDARRALWLMLFVVLVLVSFLLALGTTLAPFVAVGWEKVWHTCVYGALLAVCVWAARHALMRWRS